MKKLMLYVFVVLICGTASAQLIEGLEFVSPFHDGLASVKKAEQWGFIDEDGKMVIDFRDDLVPTTPWADLSGKNTSEGYPVFVEGYCKIQLVKEGIRFFGFIDRSGKTVIEPAYVNATNFENGYALVSDFEKKVIGKNELLGKDVVAYTLEERIIDTKGKVISSLGNTRKCLPDHFKNEPPQVLASFIGDRIVAVKGEEGKWSVYKF